jgi:hypothetical protein
MTMKIAWWIKTLWNLNKFKSQSWYNFNINNFFSPFKKNKLKALTVLDKWKLSKSYLKENEKSLFNPIGYFISLNLHVKITYMKIWAKYYFDFEIIVKLTW